jgi:IS5 family transposase
MSATIIPFELHLPTILPTIEGNVDYLDLRHQLVRIDQLLLASGLETKLIELALERWLNSKPKPPTAQAQKNYQTHCQRALRCNLARLLLKEHLRGFAARLADSPLLQFFCGLNELGPVRVPAKSTLQRYACWWPEKEVHAQIQQLLNTGQQQPEQLHLEKPLDLEAAFLDTTCVKANIHYPVDWVLFRDATRTLMKAVQLIRQQGLKHRMEEPAVFMSRMNGLCMAMSHARAKADSQTQRKSILRKMDKLVGTVRQHARRYRDLLDQQWAQTQWTRPQAQVVLRRMDQVLQQLPKARQQARQRILQGELVPSEEKILSLYESEVQVVVRHKAGAEVEFGNTLLLVESPQGLILDWDLFSDSAPGDAKLVLPAVKRMDQAYAEPPKAVGGDRGFDSELNRQKLAQRGTYNAICPRGPQQLKERIKSWKFKKLQRRRAQTEGRIGIFKNNFLGQPLRSKGFENRELTVTWGVLTHNLWVLARLPEAEAAAAKAA